MSNPHEATLSPRGALRRDAMLGQLVLVVDRTRRRRRARRLAVSAAGCAVLIGMVLQWAMPPTDGPTIARRAGTPAPSPTATVAVQRVATDPAIVERYRAAPASLVEWIDDRTLLDILTAIDRPAGIIRVGDRVALSRPVDDASLGLNQ